MNDCIAVEAGEDREVKLQQTRDQLAAESAEERETRLQQVRNQSASLAHAFSL